MPRIPALEDRAIGEQPTSWIRNARHARQLYTALFALTLSSHAPAADLGDQRNCQLEQPPQDASYSVYLGMPTRIYPDASQIGPAYSGCQTLWTIDGDSVTLDHRVYFVKGRAARLKAAEMEVDLSKCTPGKASSDDEDPCKLVADLPYKGYPRTCLKVRSAPADSQGVYIDSSCR